MAKPSRIQAEEKALQRTHSELVRQLGKDSPLRLNVRELSFARLVAEEGFTLSDAYRETFEPETENAKSINEMACRIAKRPRVAGEIERIRLEIREEGLHRQEKLSIVLDGAKARERVALEVFSIAVSDCDLKYRLKALEMVGNLKHVSAFVQRDVKIDSSSKTQVNNFGISAEMAPSEARATLAATLGRMLGSGDGPVIDVTGDVSEPVDG